MFDELRLMRHHWRGDLLSSVVVFLVALPLCMGIAIASGVPPAMGLITGIIGGLVVGVIAGAPLQVSGPAAGLSVIVWELVHEHGIVTLGIVVSIAGLVQIAAGFLHLGQWFRAVSPAVIHGMLAGIGVLIFGSQFHVMVDDVPRGSGLTNLLYIPEAIVKGLVLVDGSVHFQAAMVGLVTLATIALWRPLAPKRWKIVPAPLVAVVVGTVAAWLSGVDIAHVTVPESFFGSMNILSLSTITDLNWLLVGEGIALAFVASAETLLCATAVDKMHHGPRAKYDQELAAQGVGNLLCGIFGALPMTGVIVRSSANIDAGGKTRAPAILHGVWLLLFITALPFVLELIPIAALAAVLVFTGYKLVNVAAIRELAKYGNQELAIYFATLVTIVSVDLLSGVLVGVGLSIVKILYALSHLEVDMQPRAEGDGLDCTLRGTATVLRLPYLAARLETVPPNTAVHVHLDELDYIDHACLELIANWEKQHERTGGTFFVDWAGLQGRFRDRRTSASSVAA